MMVGYFERRSLTEKLTQAQRMHKNGWINLTGSLDATRVSKALSLSANIVRDVLDIHELPRAEFSDGVEYIFTRIPFGQTDSGKTAPFLIAISGGHYITISPHVKFSPLEVSDYLFSTTERPAGVFAANLAYIISQYEQRVHLLTEQISDARRRLSRHEVENSDFIKFVAIEDTLNEYRSSLEGMSRVITQLLENRRHLFKTRDLEALEDVDLHIRQVLVAISSSTHTISSIQNAYSTLGKAPTLQNATTFSNLMLNN
jgi:magnesium transporter